mmetsp:Transcript_36397/g.97245  ORF Transcript_36397/g.97245 Transcript_36397/m.97245 type:complete len:176 (-) Transcript_36397:161-688(-)
MAQRRDPDGAWRFDLVPTEADHKILRECEGPLGYDPGAIEEKETEDKKQGSLSKRKAAMAMNIATGPGKQIMMNGFMMYMSGSQINIFSIMITAMGLWNPINAIVNVNKAFVKVDDGSHDCTMPKLIFCALNLLSLCVALWKCKAMGLLPVTSADWTSYLIEKTNDEMSGIPIPL